jgi:hypothetical protein
MTPTTQSSPTIPANILNELKELSEVLKSIDYFTQKENVQFNARRQAIDTRITINNRKSDEYLTCRDIPEQKDHADDMLLDILSEHVQIQYLKFSQMDAFITDIYHRLGRIGASLNNVIQPLMVEYEAKHNGPSSE